MADEQTPSVDDQAPEPDHVPGTGKGEEAALKEGREPGREDLGTSHADRPAGTVRARSGKRMLEFDFIIASTGMEVDLTLRPELHHIAPCVALWGDRYTPPAELAKPLLAKFPYLGRNCEFQEKTPGSAPWASKIFTITRGATLSAGPSAASNSNMKYTAPRLIQGVTRALFLDAQQSYFDRFISHSHHELPDELVAQVGGAKVAV